MALFGRKNTNNEVPEDLQQYYNTGGTGIFKWLLRIVAGLIVLGLLVWGGIWAAHKISNNQTDQPQTAQSNNGNNANQDQKKAQEQAKAQADARKAAEEAQKKAQQAAQAQQQAQQQQSQQQPQQVATNNGGSSANGGSTQPTQTQSAGGSNGSSTPANNSNLPNTGPGDTAAVLFAGATVLGAAAHMAATRKRQLR